MAEGGSLMSAIHGPSSETVTENQTAEDRGPNVVLTLRKPKNSAKVQWTTETVDNEHMNKKKSKCCCIYEKPKVFGESSSEEEDDCTDHCHGHKKKCYKKHESHNGDGGEGISGES